MQKNMNVFFNANNWTNNTILLNSRGLKAFKRCAPLYTSAPNSRLVKSGFLYSFSLKMNSFVYVLPNFRPLCSVQGQQQKFMECNKSIWLVKFQSNLHGYHGFLIKKINKIQPPSDATGERLPDHPEMLANCGNLWVHVCGRGRMALSSEYVALLCDAAWATVWQNVPGCLSLLT